MFAYRDDDGFGAVRSSEFVQDVRDIFLDNVIAEVELQGDVVISKAFRECREYLLLARREARDGWVLGKYATDFGRN